MRPSCGSRRGRKARGGPETRDARNRAARLSLTLRPRSEALACPGRQPACESRRWPASAFSNSNASALDTTGRRVEGKELQASPSKNACFSFYFLGRFEPFQRVAREKIKKSAAGSTRLAGCVSPPQRLRLILPHARPMGSLGSTKVFKYSLIFCFTQGFAATLRRGHGNGTHPGEIKHSGLRRLSERRERNPHLAIDIIRANGLRILRQSA